MPKGKSNKKNNPLKPTVTERRGRIEPRSLVEEMRTSYLDYAMSVIVSRALPDVRDGLKPVQRRILYAMWDVGLRAAARFRKSANVVGEVMAKYHPHGDAAIYDTLARLAQDFSMRYPLVWGQGNFGSTDGDPPAAMRYTEAKLTNLSEEALYDLDKETVEFGANYDGTVKEPLCLPGKLPNLLLNGTMGIAVAVATNIPPHNLREIVDGIILLLNKPATTITELTQVIQGPDFPTGGVVYDRTAIKEASAAGRGRLITRGVAEIVERGGKADEFNIIVSEIPYQVNKAALIEHMADLVRDKKIDDIRDLRDESNKQGVRIVIELKKNCHPKKVLNQLYQHTALQTSFNYNMVALIDGLQPRLLGLKDILEEYIKHRRDVVQKRTEFELQQAKERAHILEGLKLAQTKIDAIIKTIKAARDNLDAKGKLMSKFKLTERQAVAILEMKLRQLAGLERLKIEIELKEKLQLIKDLIGLLKSRSQMDGVIKKELLELREKYGDERRTKIIAHAVDQFTQEDLIPDEPAIVILTRDGYIKRLPPETFRTQARGGKGVAGLTTREEDSVAHFFATTTHKSILFFTNKGRVFQLKAYDVPVASRTAKGQSIVNFLQLGPGESISEILPLDKLEQAKYLVMATKKGVTKKVRLDQFSNVRRSGLIAIRLKGNDLLDEVSPTREGGDIIIVTKKGQAIRFKEKGLRAMGRSAAGVRGIKLKADDEVVGMCVINSKDKQKPKVLVVSENGFGKMTNVSEYRLQGRGGSGIKTASLTKKTGDIVNSFSADPKDLPEEMKGDLIIISQHGQVIRLPLSSVSTLGRATQGVRLMRFKETADKVASVTLV